MLKTIFLKNGMSVLRFPKPSANTFLIGFVVKTGSAMEYENFPQGISQLVERLFWRGTYKHPSTKNLNLALEGLGGEFQSFTTQENTCFYIEVPTNNQYKAISFMAEIIQRSYFDSRDVELEKKNITEELKSYSQNLNYELEEASMSNIYSNSSMGLPINGYIDTINQITHTQVLEYLSHQYSPSICSVVLSGNFESKKTLELLEQEWSIWSPKVKKPIELKPFSNEDVGIMPKMNYRQRGVAQTYLSVDFILDEGYMPTNETENSEIDEKNLVEKRLENLANLMVLNAVLGQGFSSRLWAKGVEEEVLFNHIESKIQLFTMTSFLQIIGGMDNLQFSFGLECILSTLDSLRKTTVSINELSKTKSYLKGLLVRQHENLFVNTVWNVENYLGSGLIYDLDKLLEKIDKVEAPALRSIALDLFIPERMSITTLGTAKETRLVDKLISKYLG